MRYLVLVVAFAVTCWASIDKFGVLHGLGVIGAIMLLMPWHPKSE